MAWYSQTDLNTNTENSSLTVALANLLRKLGYEASLPDMAMALAQPDWWTVQTVYPDVVVREVYDNDTWPNTDNAIIRFQRVDVATAGMVDHYCLVADHRVRSIVDSLDGVIKQADAYGSPQGWASYAKKITPDNIDDETLLDHPAEASRPNQLYKVLQGETIWDIARKLNISATDLIEHNDIANPRDIVPGYILHLPVPRELPKTPQIRYVMLSSPKPMHVTRSGGATKWLFGNAKKWTDITASGRTHPEDANVDIRMVAYVPIGTELAKYLMDAHAVGDYATTGRVAYTVGFNHSHLGDGYAVEKKPVEAPAPEPVAPPEPPPLKLKPTPAALTRYMDVAPKINPNLFKTTYKAFPKPEMYLVNDTIMVHDHDNKRPSVTVFQNRGVVLAGTFVKNGVLYGRPEESVLRGTWFGVPMHRARLAFEASDAEPLGDVPLVERLQKGRLAFDERYLTVPLSRALSQYVKFTKIFSPKTKVTKE
jgi:hypothetical protein